MRRPRWKILVAGLAVVADLVGLISCSSVEAPEQVPISPSDSASPEASASSDLTPPSAESPVASAPSGPSLSTSDVETPQLGTTPSPSDKGTSEAPSQPARSSASKVGCWNDDQCERDQFCDLGRCAAIRSARPFYGKPCLGSDARACGTLPCIDGRCRSCVSDKECEWARHIQDPRCKPDVFVPGGRTCIGVIPSIVPDMGQGPLPRRPEQ